MNQETDLSNWSVVDDSRGQEPTHPMMTPSKKTSSDSDLSDWQVVPEAPASAQRYPNEGLGTAMIKAPFRVAEDLYKGGAGFIKNIPGYVQSAKTEVPGLFNTMQQHPLHATKQAIAGLAEMGHNILNTPHGLAQYGADRLNLIPQSAADKIPFQKDISGDINQIYGEPQYSGEKLMRGIGRNANTLLGGVRVASALNPMNLSARSIAREVVNTRNANRERYGQHYTNLFNEANANGVGDMTHVVPNIDIRTMRRFAPESKITRVEDLINNPTAQNAHFAKSDLLGIQRQLNSKASLTGGERRLLDATNNAVNAIRTNMFRDRAGHTHEGLNNRYNTLQEGYEREVVPYTTNNAIKKYARRNPKITAKELVNSLSKGEFAAQRGGHHPAIQIRNFVKDHYGKVGSGAMAGWIMHNALGTHPQEE